MLRPRFCSANADTEALLNLAVVLVLLASTCNECLAAYQPYDILVLPFPNDRASETTTRLP